MSCGSFPEVNGFYKGIDSATYEHTSNEKLTLSRKSDGEWEFRLHIKAICRSSGSSEDPSTLPQWTYLKRSYFSENWKACTDMRIIRAASSVSGTRVNHAHIVSTHSDRYVIYLAYREPSGHHIRKGHLRPRAGVFRKRYNRATTWACVLLSSSVRTPPWSKMQLFREA